MVLGRKRCIGTHLHGRVIVVMGAAPEQKRRTSERKGKERRARKGERKMFLYLSLVSRREC